MGTYYLKWPGFQYMPLYFIEKESKSIYHEANPIPFHKKYLSAYHYQYVSLEDVLSLFSPKAMISASQQLILFNENVMSSQVYKDKKTGELYVHLNTLIAYLLVFPYCPEFQRTRSAVLMFLMNYYEFICMKCGFTNRDCECTPTPSILSKIDYGPTELIGKLTTITTSGTQTDVVACPICKDPKAFKEARNPVLVMPPNAHISSGEKMCFTMPHKPGLIQMDPIMDENTEQVSSTSNAKENHNVLKSKKKPEMVSVAIQTSRSGHSSKNSSSLLNLKGIDEKIDSTVSSSLSKINVLNPSKFSSVFDKKTLEQMRNEEEIRKKKKGMKNLFSDKFVLAKPSSKKKKNKDRIAKEKLASDTGEKKKENDDKNLKRNENIDSDPKISTEDKIVSSSHSACEISCKNYETEAAKDLDNEKYVECDKDFNSADSFVVDRALVEKQSVVLEEISSKDTEDLLSTENEKLEDISKEEASCASTEKISVSSMPDFQIEKSSGKSMEPVATLDEKDVTKETVSNQADLSLDIVGDSMIPGDSSKDIQSSSAEHINKSIKSTYEKPNEEKTDSSSLNIYKENRSVTHSLETISLIEEIIKSMPDFGPQPDSSSCITNNAIEPFDEKRINDNFNSNSFDNVSEDKKVNDAIISEPPSEPSTKNEKEEIDDETLVENSAFVLDNDLPVSAVQKGYAEFDFVPTGERLVRCVLFGCGQCFDTESHAQIHVKCHEPKGHGLRCYLCDNYNVPTTKWYNVIRHLQEKHQVEMQKSELHCKFCGLDFGSIEARKKHELFHHYSQYKCIHCSEQLFTWNHVEHHLNERCPEKTRDHFYYSCPYCHYVFQSPSVHQMHIHSHCDEGLTCCICKDGLTWASWHCLKKHYLSIHLSQGTKKKLKCSKCSTLFASLEKYNIHQEQRHSGKPFDKDDIDIVQETENILDHNASKSKDFKKHKRNKKRSKYKLDDSDYEYDSDFLFKNRDRGKRAKHNEEQETGKDSLNNTKNELITVVEPPVATEERLPMVEKVLNKEIDQEVDDIPPILSHTCNICYKTYRTKQRLDLHVENSHEEAQCDKCEFLARNRYLLKTHIQQKHDSKQHVCSECGKAFAAYYKLKVHLASHARNTNYPCKACDSVFPNSKELRLHQLQEHPQEASKAQQECPECDFQCFSKTTLKLHISKKHGDLEDEDSVDHCYFNKRLSPPPPKRPKTTIYTRPRGRPRGGKNKGRVYRSKATIVEERNVKEKERSEKKIRIRCRKLRKNTAARTRTFDENIMVRDDDIRRGEHNVTVKEDSEQEYDEEVPTNVVTAKRPSFNWNSDLGFEENSNQTLSDNNLPLYTNEASNSRSSEKDDFENKHNYDNNNYSMQIDSNVQSYELDHNYCQPRDCPDLSKYLQPTPSYATNALPDMQMNYHSYGPQNYKSKVVIQSINEKVQKPKLAYTQHQPYDKYPKISETDNHRYISPQVSRIDNSGGPRIIRIERVNKPQTNTLSPFETKNPSLSKLVAALSETESNNISNVNHFNQIQQTHLNYGNNSIVQASSHMPNVYQNQMNTTSHSESNDHNISGGSNLESLGDFDESGLLMPDAEMQDILQAAVRVLQDQSDMDTSFGDMVDAAGDSHDMNL